MSDPYDGPECQQKYMVKKDAKVQKPKENYSIRFHNADNEEVGYMDFNGQGIEFEGIASESAMVFIHWIDTVFKGRLEEEYQRGFEEGKTRP